MRELLLPHRDPGTPVVIGRDVSGPGEDVRVVRLADLDPASVDMRCLLIVGSSQTQWYTTEPGGRRHPAEEPGGRRHPAEEPGGRRHPAEEPGGRRHPAEEPGGRRHPAEESQDRVFTTPRYPGR